ncbi:hypothetical protein GGR09_000145 [Bartonella heixiaziensis]
MNAFYFYAGYVYIKICKKEVIFVRIMHEGGNDFIILNPYLSVMRIEK